MKIAIGISGASGSIYAKKIIEFLDKNHELFVAISETAKKIFSYEIGITFDNFAKNFNFKQFNEKDFYSPIASGSFKIDTYIIIPCSMKTLSAIANGYADTLITRCADVAIKQKRKLILLPRETPFSAIHLENMLKLANLGASIIVPSPAFYHKPQTIDDLVNFIVGKVLDELDIEHEFYKPWGVNN